MVQVSLIRDMRFIHRLERLRELQFLGVLGLRFKQFCLDNERHVHIIFLPSWLPLGTVQGRRCHRNHSASLLQMFGIVSLSLLGIQ